MAHTARHGLARRWSLWYQEYPVLLSPVWSQPAFPLDFDIASLDNAIATLELMRPVLPANLLGTPAAVVPAGMADGLPVGVQVMGGKYTELRCLAVAEAIEQRLGPTRSPRSTRSPIDLPGELRALSQCRYRIWVVGKLMWLLPWLRWPRIRLDRRRVRDHRHAQDQLVTRVLPWGQHRLINAFREPRPSGR